MDVNEHETQSNFTLRHKLKLINNTFISVLHYTVTVESSTMRKTQNENAPRFTI